MISVWSVRLMRGLMTVDKIEDSGDRKIEYSVWNVIVLQSLWTLRRLSPLEEQYKELPWLQYIHYIGLFPLNRCHLQWLSGNTKRMEQKQFVSDLPSIHWHTLRCEQSTYRKKSATSSIAFKCDTLPAAAVVHYFRLRITAAIPEPRANFHSGGGLDCS